MKLPKRLWAIMVGLVILVVVVELELFGKYQILGNMAASMEFFGKSVLNWFSFTLNWFSLTKMMELSVIASAIAVIITGLFAMDYFSQESRIALDLEGPVHGVVKPRFIQYFKDRNLPPSQIKLDSLLSKDPSYTARAFLNEVPIDETYFRFEKLPEEGRSLTGLLKWAIPVGKERDSGSFMMTQKCKNMLGKISYDQEKKILEALVRSTVSAIRLNISNTGSADAIDVTLNIMAPYPEELLISPYEEFGELLRSEGLGQNRNLRGKNTFTLNLAAIKKGEIKTIKVYTVGEPIRRKDLAISKSDKPRFNKTQAVIVFLFTEILILGTFIAIDIVKRAIEKTG